MRGGKPTSQFQVWVNWNVADFEITTVGICSRAPDLDIVPVVFQSGRDIGQYFLRPTYHVVTEHRGHRNRSNSQKHFLVVVTTGVLICESTKLALEPD